MFAKHYFNINIKNIAIWEGYMKTATGTLESRKNVLYLK